MIPAMFQHNYLFSICSLSVRVEGHAECNGCIREGSQHAGCGEVSAGLFEPRYIQLSVPRVWTQLEEPESLFGDNGE